VRLLSVLGVVCLVIVLFTHIAERLQISRAWGGVCPTVPDTTST
jgi:hypothetical protein